MADNTQTVFRKKTLDPVRDELIADAVGLYAAFGRFDPEKDKLFLGVRDGHYIGGRLENYCDNATQLAGPVSEMLGRFCGIIGEHPDAAPFDLIPVLQEYQESFRTMLP